jgi:DNA primase
MSLVTAQVHSKNNIAGKERIPQEFINELIDIVDIVDIVGESVELKKNGNGYHACCPFHNEKTPSFTVSDIKKFYHCFGCGENGNAITFLMKDRSMSFVDAVRYLADKVGKKIPIKSYENQNKIEKVNPVLHDRLRQACHFYQKQLLNNVKATSYLIKRGIKPLTAVRYGIGYAPSGWQNLESVFASYESIELELCGLVTKGEGKRSYDRFRSRIMIPILSADGLIIGFGGRVIDDTDPKYLNSPETSLFDKSSELFGLPQASQSIRETGIAIVVEGYMDVISLSESGIKNVVGTMGTATTSVHAKKLLRLADKVIFCFDGDSAGRKASWKAMENIIPFIADNKSACFSLLPVGEDPDSFVRSNGKDKFLDLCREAMPLSTYLIKSLIERNKPESAEGQAKLIYEAKPIMSKLRVPQASLLRTLMIKQLSNVCGFTPVELDNIFSLE